jgi:Ni/Co efflux regulator RcnB
MRIAAKTNSPASPKHFSWRGVVVLLLALLVTSLATPSFAAQTTTAQTATKSHTRARHHRAHHVRAKYRTHHRAHARSHRARAKKSVTAPKAAVAHVSQPAAPVKSAPAAFARTSAKTAPRIKLELQRLLRPQHPRIKPFKPHKQSPTQTPAKLHAGPPTIVRRPPRLHGIAMDCALPQPMPASIRSLIR